MMVSNLTLTLIKVSFNILWLVIPVYFTTVQRSLQAKAIKAKFVQYLVVSSVEMYFTWSVCAVINDSKNVYILPEQLCTRIMVMDFCWK